MARALGAPAVLSNFSRLLIDPNRGLDDPTLVMRLSDGAIVPGNRHLDEAGIAARMIADAQLALIDAWILGRPACTVEAAAEALQRVSAAMASALGATASERQATDDMLLLL